MGLLESFLQTMYLPQQLTKHKLNRNQKLRARYLRLKLGCKLRQLNGLQDFSKSANSKPSRNCLETEHQNNFEDGFKQGLLNKNYWKLC